MNILQFLLIAALQADMHSVSVVSFDDALLNKRIVASAVANKNTSHYQQPVLMQLKNITTTEIVVELPVGRYFQSTDTTDQNFVSTEPIMVTLLPGQIRNIPVSAMCVNHHKSSPSEGQLYSIKKPAPSKLLKTAQYIHQNKLFGTYLGQTVMWCVSDNESLENVFSYQELGVGNALAFLSTLTGKPIPKPPADDDYLRNPQAKPKINVGGSFEFTFSKPKSVHIAMFDAQNIAVRELYNNPVEPAGSRKVDFAFDGSVYNDGVYFIRFMCDNKIIMEQEMSL